MVSARISNNMGFLVDCVSGESSLPEEEVAKLAALTGTDRQEVELQYEQFLKHHKHGRISRRSFQNLLQKSWPGISSGALGKLSQHIFRMYDTNQDGNIDFTEFILMLHIMKEGSPEQNLRQIFKIFDINSDGGISMKELRKILKDFRDLMESEGEEALARTAFDEMDADQDGKIDEEEFVNACLEGGKASSSIALKIVTLFVKE